MSSVCFGYIFQCQDEFSVILNIFYSTVPIATLVGSGSHTHTVSGAGHPNVDFTNTIFGGIEYFPSSHRRQYSEFGGSYPIYFLASWRLAPNAAFSGLPAGNALFGGANRPKRRRVNYTINRSFSHLIITLIGSNE